MGNEFKLTCDRRSVVCGIESATLCRVQKALAGERIRAFRHAPPGPASFCESYREEVLRKLEQGLSAKRIHQDLTSEFGFTGSYYSVLRLVRKLESKQPLPFRRLETAPGEEAQIDFGTGAWVVGDDGKKRRPWMFRIVLRSSSRKAYSDVVWRQTTDNFLTAIENAFYYFGGVPKRLVIDNLKT